VGEKLRVYAALGGFADDSNDAVVRDTLPNLQKITKILEDEVCYGEREDRIGISNEMSWGEPIG
jgi:hypothetical protein